MGGCKLLLHGRPRSRLPPGAALVLPAACRLSCGARAGSRRRGNPAGSAPWVTGAGPHVEFS